VSERTATVNKIRTFLLERGVAAEVCESAK
jgi:hypothetical protein